MKVSIITPSYNSAKFIQHTIESVLNQTFFDWELLIVDDCSTDNSCEVIQKFVEQDRRIKLICLNENSGAAVARNTGIENACGRFIAFLDSDDTWHPEKLEKQVHFMLSNNFAFTYTEYHRVDENGNFLGAIYTPSKINYSGLLKTCVIGCLTVMYDIHMLGKVYFPLIRKRQDWALWLKILKKVDYAYCLNKDLASYTIRSESISANKFNAGKYTWLLFTQIEKLNIFKAIYCYGHYVLRGVIRTKLPKISTLLKI